MSEATFPLSPLGAAQPDNPEASAAADATPGGSEPVRWVVVWQGPGLLPAQIVANRLRSEGIPANPWQEGAGRAIGLTIGILGTGFVSVPEAFEVTARDLLALEIDWYDDEADEDDESE